MQRFLLATCALALISTNALGQTYQTSPNGFVTAEGYQRSYIFGEWSDARLMFIDGEMRNSVMVMKEVALRHDQTDYYAGNGMGRTWSNVTLDISFGDITNINQTFSLNQTSSPSRVFSASVTFPTITGLPANNPADWNLRFPFSSTFVNTGSDDICLDFDFNGGVLANRGRWTPNWYQTYYTDALNGGSSAQGNYVKFGTGCTDSSNSNRGQAVLFTSVYNTKHPTSGYHNKYKTTSRVRYTAGGKPVVHVLSVFGLRNGVPFPGVGCENVFIDLTKPFIVLPRIAGSTTVKESLIDFPLVDYNPALENAELWIQAAWDDSRTGALHFTDAELSFLPPMPRSYKRAMIYQNDPTMKSTIALPSQGSLISPFYESTHNPIFRYAQ